MNATHQLSNTKAALWMVAWLALMLTMMVASREVTREIGVLQLMEMRSVIGFLMLLPLVFAEGGIAAMRSQFMGRQIVRNVVHYSGQAMWLYALTLIPLAHLISIEFTTPLWTAVLAVMFLGERLNALRVAALALGIVGVLVIVRPDADVIDTGHLIVLAAAILFAVSVILVKAMTRTESAVKIMFWMLLIQSVIGLIPALWIWKWPSLYLWPFIVIVAFCGSFAHYCQARALQHADASVVVPMDFLRVPLAALIGYLLYSENIDGFTAVGALFILSGNVLNLQRKAAPSPASAA